ncbi:hypothetical protein LX36DRAFT_259239 [Colletotrichum falcatum]|nr:hypothetical protein LX36DRAFT_259239 [Colletotrichum falcatum]
MIFLSSFKMRVDSERTERGEGVSCKSQGEGGLGRSRERGRRRRRRFGTSRWGATKKTSSAPMMKATAERTGFIHIKVAFERGTGKGGCGSFRSQGTSQNGQPYQLDLADDSRFVLLGRRCVCGRGTRERGASVMGACVPRWGKHGDEQQGYGPGTKKAHEEMAPSIRGTSIEPRRQDTPADTAGARGFGKRGRQGRCVYMDRLF